MERIKIVEEEALLSLPKNPLLDKYPPSPMPQYSQVCDGYSCMWCSRCPKGDNWKCPEEDREVYEQYKKELREYLVRVGILPY